MKFSPLHASLLALAVFSGPAAALAAAPEAQAPMVIAQADSAGETQDFEAVRKFLANGRDLSQMDEGQLRQRLKRAERLSKTEDLPPDLASELQQSIASLESELAKRQQASGSSSSDNAQSEAEQQPVQRKKQQPESQQEAQQQPPEQQAQAQPEQPQAKQAAPEQPSSSAGSASDGEVAAFLQSVRPVSELDDREIRRQVRRASELAQQKGLSSEQRKALRDVIRDGRQALRNKGGNDQAQTEQGAGGSQPQPPQPEQAQPPQQSTQQSVAPQPPASQQQAKVNPALEQRAQAILNDKVDVRTMKRRDLRQRLSGIRDLLASGELSPQTTEALRRKLAEERAVLRNEVAAEDGGNQPPQSQPQTGTSAQTRPGQPGEGTGGGGYRPPRDRDRDRNGSDGPNFDITIVLGDTRPPDQLPEDELVRRIDVYRDVVVDERYSAIERERWRRQMERDRFFLRERMLEERRAREARLRSGEVEFDIDVEDDYVPDRRVPPSVFAAEVEDEEIADVLAAPPRRRIERRYTVDEIERSPEARDAVARIEIDTVHFGFGEGFLREEEIDKLDRIAQVLEKILAKNPNEVFLLEGHTDAVGSAGSNLQLSRERARAVKQALTTYYVIPAENLETVGLGERYLKIPTEAPEAENRRVSLARITPLVGQAQ